jgi:hypothetical protein
VEAIDEIAERHKPQVFDVYRSKVLIDSNDVITVYPDPSTVLPTVLKIGTLQGVADYVSGELAGIEGLVVAVESPTSVKVLVPVFGEQRQQLIFVQANPVLPTIPLGQYLDAEQFLIILQTCFVESDARTAVQTYAAQFSSKLMADIEDDGISQSVQTQRGLTRASVAQAFKNPTLLAPFRTFPEIAQPVSPFILRMKQDSSSGELTAKTTLLEADGGAWRPPTIKAIGAWLAAELPAGTPILA